MAVSPERRQFGPTEEDARKAMALRAELMEEIIERIDDQHGGPRKKIGGNKPKKVHPNNRHSEKVEGISRDFL